MRSNLSADERAKAVEAWNLAFCSVDPFGWPFSPALNVGRILFPTDGCQLSHEQFSALAKVAEKSGETLCYLAVVEGQTSLDLRAPEKLRSVDLGDYESYRSLHLTLENALFSKSGSWGVLVSHEMHAVIGSDASFVSHFNRIDRSAEDQWNMFLVQWRAEKHQDWVTEIAMHANPAGEKGYGEQGVRS